MTFSNELLLEPITDIVKKTKLQHIAIIMDGNRRWAKLHNLPSKSGHSAGVKSLKTAVKLFNEFGIKYLTVYAFSTENWGRKKEEVDFLMFLMAETFKKELNDLHKNNVRIRVIGDISELNNDLQKVLLNSVKTTENNTGLNLQLAINYGSRKEVINAIKSIINDIDDKKVDINNLNEELLSEYLYTKNIPDPDLLIRTGGEMRLSNYLLWQIAYAEFYVTNTLWPDFGKDELTKAIYEFANRNRRYGKD